MADLFGENDGELGEDEEDDEEEEDILDMEGGPTMQREEALLMRFCPHDSSMLYPQVSALLLSRACWMIQI